MDPNWIVTVGAAVLAGLTVVVSQRITTRILLRRDDPRRSE